VPSFADAKLPPGVLALLASKGITQPTPIQMQGLPVALAGRDLIGIASTGSGKTLAFGLPLLVLAAQEEVRLPLAGGEGPVGLVIAPSRELARQTHQVLEEYAAAMAAGGGGGGGGGDRRGAPPLRFPPLRCMLCTGGVDSRAQTDAVRSEGVHAISATPGRLKDLLTRRRLTLGACRYLCLDEADRMVDLGFEDDVRAVLSFFTAGRQTVMFSATMPPKIAAFAGSALNDPITVHVGRAGAASLDVIQEVEYVKAEARLPYLLDCLQKTAPPVLIFAEGQRDVDDILEFLLMKGVEAVATHGGKDQEERSAAVDAFKAGTADVLVATDVASKGLDFPDVRHVINFDMPAAIEDYTHRIGRTGRGGKTGIATTFINRAAGEAIMLDLKRLLEEARQRVPPFLAGLVDPDAELQAAAEAAGVKGCAFCGGLGHRITACPKLDAQNRETQRKQKDWFGQGGFGGET
jgi:ATP-dependent RNA helicase DDX41